MSADPTTEAPSDSTGSTDSTGPPPPPLDDDLFEPGRLEAEQTVYRLVRRRWVETALDGRGAKRVGGRWNPVGVPVAYCATSRALALAEMLVHADLDEAPEDWTILPVRIPEGLATHRLVADHLPPGWRALPAPAALAELGAHWFHHRASVALFVPSAVVAREWNVLLHPHHPDRARLVVDPPEPFEVDPRLL